MAKTSLATTRRLGSSRIDISSLNVDRLLGTYVEDIMRGFGRQVVEGPSSRRIRREANHRMASLMKRSMLSYYAETVGLAGSHPRYRAGQNRLPGTLRKALNRTGMVSVDGDRLRYVNTAILNAEARHWARLNYGAMPAVTPPGFVASLRLDGKRLGDVSVRARPRPTMLRPVGVFQQMSNGVAFYPQGKRATIPTKGIVGRNYLDGGIFALERNFDPVYGRMLGDIAAAAIRAAARKTKVVIVRV